jgi:hypothetical protein
MKETFVMSVAPNNKRECTLLDGVDANRIGNILAMPQRR